MESKQYVSRLASESREPAIPDEKRLEKKIENGRVAARRRRRRLHHCSSRSGGRKETKGRTRQAAALSRLCFVRSSGRKRESVKLKEKNEMTEGTP
jgi:hypothetical protein